MVHTKKIFNSILDTFHILAIICIIIAFPLLVDWSCRDFPSYQCIFTTCGLILASHLMGYLYVLQKPGIVSDLGCAGMGLAGAFTLAAFLKSLPPGYLIAGNNDADYTWNEYIIIICYGAMSHAGYSAEMKLLASAAGTRDRDQWYPMGILSLLLQTPCLAYDSSHHDSKETKSPPQDSTGIARETVLS